MEGRKKLPLNIHPFPDDIDVWKKFWNTPLSKAFFKFAGTCVAFSIGLGLTNMYLTRNTGFLGMDYSVSKEQYLAKERLKAKTWDLKQYDFITNIGFKHTILGNDRYDDGIELRSRQTEMITPVTGKNTLMML